jgi:hypothetical protein
MYYREADHPLSVLPVCMQPGHDDTIARWCLPREGAWLRWLHQVQDCSRRWAHALPFERHTAGTDDEARDMYCQQIKKGDRFLVGRVGEHWCAITASERAIAAAFLRKIPSHG